MTHGIVSYALQLVERPAPEPTDKDIIISLVCNYYKVTRKALQARRAGGGPMFPRQMAMTLLVRYADLSLKQAGMLFGRHHSTVISAMKRVDDLVYTEESRRKEYRWLEGQINLHSSQ